MHVVLCTLAISRDVVARQWRDTPRETRVTDYIKLRYTAHEQPAHYILVLQFTTRRTPNTFPQSSKLMCCNGPAADHLSARTPNAAPPTRIYCTSQSGVVVF